MMKNAFLILFCLGAFSTTAQDRLIPVNEETGLAEYVDVVTVAATADTVLHQRAINWIHDFYKNPHGVIQSDDSTTLEVNGKARFRLTTPGDGGRQLPSGYVAYSFSLQFKEGRYRYQIHRIHWQKPSYFDVSRWENTDDPTYDEELYPQFVEQAVNYFNTWIDQFEEAMATPELEIPSDW